MEGSIASLPSWPRVDILSASGEGAEISGSSIAAGGRKSLLLGGKGIGLIGIDESWLDLGEEEPLDPDLRICDPHHHQWDRPDGRYMREELLRDVSGHRVEKTVFIECGSKYREGGSDALGPVGETEFVEEIAKQGVAENDICELNAGIVAHADLLLGDDVCQVLEAHQAASPQRFRGIRHSAAWHPHPSIRPSHSNPPPHMFELPVFRRGFAQLKHYDLSFDAWIFHTQLDELYDLVRFAPEVPVVLNHAGGPLGIGPFVGLRREVLEAWEKAIGRLAECPNVHVKLGGLQMALSGFRWHERSLPPTSVELAQAARPYIMYCIDCFGVDRCMFESNFPVDKVSSSYNVLWNSFKRLTENFSHAERESLFRLTAELFYRI